MGEGRRFPAAARPDDEAGAGTRASLDRIAVEDAIRRERRARDMHLWDELAECYHADSLIDISWFRGTGAEFAAASRAMAERVFSFHELDPPLVAIDGDRAISDMGVTIHLSGPIGDVMVECRSRCRSLGRIERKDGAWRMAGHGVVYLHDWLIPSEPDHIPELDAAVLKTLRKPYRYLAYLMNACGLPVADDLPAIDRPETVSAVIGRELAWLCGD